MTFRIIQGDNRDTLKTLADNSVDAIVTDPPYGIDFLGKSWDANTGALETYQECLRVLKPGGHILAFSAARTYHHLAVTLEQAGFEIRDQIMWIYSSGFPKSQDIGKSIERSEGKRNAKSFMGKAANTNSVSVHTDCPNCDKRHGTITIDGCSTVGCPIMEKLKPADNEWAGWGTALKPAHEPIALARKPIKLSIAKNAQQWGTGALNIDACRIDWDEEAIANIRRQNALGGEIVGGGIEKYATVGEDADSKHETQRVLLNEQGRFPSNVIGEILQADYQKYFYCPKVSRKERHIGFADPDYSEVPKGIDGGILNTSGGLNHDRAKYVKDGNNHPTVKPIELMKYLIKLITPPGGVVLDPFNGSGSTGCAAVELGFEYIGCELDPAYVAITEKRIAAWTKEENIFGELFTE